MIETTIKENQRKIIGYTLIGVMLCLLMFLLGYSSAAQAEVGKANAFIQEFVNEYPCAAEAKIGGGFDYSGYGFDNINITLT